MFIYPVKALAIAIKSALDESHITSLGNGAPECTHSASQK